jgi:hypothetical protein
MLADRLEYALTTRRDRVCLLVTSCVPLASLAGGVVFAITFANTEGYGDSTLMIAAHGGLATGSVAALVTWFVRRATTKNHGLLLRNVKPEDMILAGLAALVCSPVALVVAINVMPLGALVVEPIDALCGETIAFIVALSLPATLFFLATLTALQSTLESRLIERTARCANPAELPPAADKPQSADIRKSGLSELAEKMAAVRPATRLRYRL